MLKILITVCAVLAAASSHALNGDAATWVKRLQDDWAVANYSLREKAQRQAFEDLLVAARQARTDYPQSAEVLVWEGIIKSTYAGIKGGLGALSLAKESRDALQQAMAIDDEVLAGSAYTSLGILYAKVPGWPVGFGDKKKAGKLLGKALELNPDGIDTNYFYASYLLELGDYSLARTYLLKARNAAPRPGRELADAGRRREIEAALAEVAAHLR